MPTNLPGPSIFNQSRLGTPVSRIARSIGARTICARAIRVAVLIRAGSRPTRTTVGAVGAGVAEAVVSTGSAVVAVAIRCEVARVSASAVRSVRLAGRLVRLAVLL